MNVSSEHTLSPAQKREKEKEKKKRKESLANYCYITDTHLSFQTITKSNSCYRYSYQEFSSQSDDFKPNSS